MQAASSRPDHDGLPMIHENMRSGVLTRTLEHREDFHSCARNLAFAAATIRGSRSPLTWLACLRMRSAASAEPKTFIVEPYQAPKPSSSLIAVKAEALHAYARLCILLYGIDETKSGKLHAVAHEIGTFMVEAYYSVKTLVLVLNHCFRTG